MNRIIFVLLLSLMAASNCHANEKDHAFLTINKLFTAMSKFDHQGMRGTVTDSFVLLEHGEVWSIDDLIKVVSPSEYVRTNYFSIIKLEIKYDIAIVNYWNKANFNNTHTSEDVIWLESAVLEKINGQWLLSQMHSTRLSSGTSPKNVKFIKQKE